MKKILLILLTLLFTLPLTAQEQKVENKLRVLKIKEKQNPEYHPSDLDPLSEESIYSYNQRNKGVQAVLQHLRVSEELYMKYCMNKNAPMGCKKRITSLVNMIFTAAHYNNINPWTLLGLSIETTNFNPYNVDENVISGIFGIPYKCNWCKKEQYYNDKKYREECRAEGDACQKDIINNVAELIAKYIKRCKTEKDGLEAYFSGRCHKNSKFPTYVLRWSKILQERAENVPDINFCIDHPKFCSDPISGL